MPQDERTDFEEASSGGFEDEKTDAIDPEGLIESNYDKITDNFDDMSLREDLLRGKKLAYIILVSFSWSVVPAKIQQSILSTHFIFYKHAVYKHTRAEIAYILSTL